MVGAGLPHALVDRTRDDVARREVGERVHAGHERDTVAVAEHRALAAQRLREERPRHRRMVQRRRVELHELEIGARDPAAAPSAMPSPVDSVGLVVTAKHWPTPPVASTRVVARTTRPSRRAAARATPAAVPALDEQLDREPAFADFDRRGLDRGHERALDLGAGRVAARVHDPRERVAAFPREQQTCRRRPRSSVSNCAPSSASSRTRAGPFGDEHADRVDVAQPRARPERVGEMQVGRVGVLRARRRHHPARSASPSATAHLS